MQGSLLVSIYRVLGVLVGTALVVGGLLLNWGEVRAQEESITLHDGWSNVAYQGEVLPVDQALTDALDVVLSVWHWEGDEQSWLGWFAGSLVASTLVVLEPGEAYWIRASAERSWTPRTAVLFEVAQVQIESGSTSSLEVELADTPTKRGRGLMFRQELEPEAGMLFIFPGDTGSGFWMQNTFVPLSIAFVDSDGVIVDIQDMEPLSTAIHSPGALYRWALEVNQGWFAANGVAVGDVVSLVES